jgi:hypothetical protein
MITVFFTRLSDEQGMDAETRRLRWIRLDYRLRALVVKIAKIFTPENMPEKFLELMKFWVEENGDIIRDFVIPFEARLLPMMKGLGKNTMKVTEVNDREMWVMSTCFLVQKVLVGKLLFKPYKLRRLLKLTKKDTDFNTFDQNCVQIGYLV